MSLAIWVAIGLLAVSVLLGLLRVMTARLSNAGGGG